MPSRQETLESFKGRSISPQVMLSAALQYTPMGSSSGNYQIYNNNNPKTFP